MKAIITVALITVYLIGNSFISAKYIKGESDPFHWWDTVSYRIIFIFDRWETFFLLWRIITVIIKSRITNELHSHSVCCRNTVRTISIPKLSRNYSTRNFVQKNTVWNGIAIQPTIKATVRDFREEIGKLNISVFAEIKMNLTITTRTIMVKDRTKLEQLLVQPSKLLETF